MFGIFETMLGYNHSLETAEMARNNTKMGCNCNSDREIANTMVKY